MEKAKLGINNKEGFVAVSRLIIENKEVLEDSVKCEKIMIKPFITNTAFVQMEVGEKHPLPIPYSNRMVNVTIGVPCYVEDVINVIPQVLKLANAVLKKELEVHFTGIRSDRIRSDEKDISSGGGSPPDVLAPDKKEEKTEFGLSLDEMGLGDENDDLASLLED